MQLISLALPEGRFSVNFDGRFANDFQAPGRGHAACTLEGPGSGNFDVTSIVDPGDRVGLHLAMLVDVPAGGSFATVFCTADSASNAALSAYNLHLLAIEAS